MEFHKAIARVSTAHICRAAGVERSSAPVLDTLNDVLTKYLSLLSEVSMKAARARGSDDANIEDCMLALNECQAVHRRLSADPSVEDIVEFMNWLRSPLQSRMVNVSRPQLQLNNQLASAQGAALAALPSATAAAAVASGSAPKELKDPKAPLEPSTDQAKPNTGKEDQLIADIPELKTDWLQSAVNRQILMGHMDWFVNTEFGQISEPDHEIYDTNPNPINTETNEDET